MTPLWSYSLSSASHHFPRGVRRKFPVDALTCSRSTTPLHGHNLRISLHPHTPSQCRPIPLAARGIDRSCATQQRCKKREQSSPWRGVEPRSRAVREMTGACTNPIYYQGLSISENSPYEVQTAVGSLKNECDIEFPIPLKSRAKP